MTRTPPCLAILVATLWFVAPLRAGEPAAPQPVRFDAAQLREGRFTYELRSDGELLGTSVIEIRRRTPDEYLIRMDAPAVKQHWSASVGRRFNPFTASLEMTGGKSPYRMSLSYSANEVSGTELKAGATHPVAAVIKRQVVDQRVDWAAVMAAQFPGGNNIEFDVYDPGTGFSMLVGTKMPAKRIAGVLGKQPAIRLDYTIHKADHTESYSVYATKSEPRVMLREDMPNGLVALLVAAEN
jgi:hypothetical protein